jgi:hypothetical protein
MVHVAVGKNHTAFRMAFHVIDLFLQLIRMVPVVITFTKSGISPGTLSESGERLD